MRKGRLAGTVLAFSLAGGFVVGVLTLLQPDTQARLARAATVPNMLDGKFAATVNNEMAHHLAADVPLSTAAGLIQYWVFSSGGPQVGVGCDGWLFIREELRFWPDGEALLARRLAVAQKVAAKLTAKNAALRVVLLPDKARIRTDRLCGLRVATQQAGRYDAALAGLHDIPVSDARASLQGPGADFYRTDTHLTPEGVRRVLSSLASIGDRRFTTAKGAAVPRAGDLLRLMGLDHVPDVLRPPADIDIPEQTRPEAVGLLDDDDAPASVGLAGTSFSRNGNFSGALAQMLHADVENFARDGGGFAVAMANLLESEWFRKGQARTVIWEIPERYLMAAWNDDDTRLETLAR